MDYDASFDPYLLQADEDDETDTPDELEEEEWAEPGDEELGDIPPDEGE